MKVRFLLMPALLMSVFAFQNCDKGRAQEDSASSHPQLQMPSSNDVVEGVVTGLYKDILNRPPTAEELRNALQLLETGLMTATQLAHQLANSPEALQNIENLLKGYFGDTANIQPWADYILGQLNLGVTFSEIEAWFK